METIPFSDLRGFSALFRAYVMDFERVAPFFAHDPFAPGALHAAAQQALAAPRDRETLVRVLRRQHARWGTDAPLLANIDRLADPRTVAVVTGQQLGLFTGPIYTLYKTITAIQLARRLSAEGQPTVPVFWLHGEDHDFAEIAPVTVLSGTGRGDETPLTLRYEHPMPGGGNSGPVGRLVLTDDILRVLDALEAALPDTADRARLMRVLRAAYAPGTTMTDAFARFAQALFAGTGLVLLDPDDAELKNLLVPLFQHDVRASGTVAEAVGQTSSRLVDEGFHAQVHVTPTNVFSMDAQGRLPIDAEGEGFRVRATERAYTQEALLAEIAAHPERFSPNVLLRPLAQDTLLPTVAYVAGPGEAAYFAQFRAAYEAAGVPMPVVYPRVSATLVEPRVQKLLARHGLTLPALDRRPDMAFQHLVAERMDGAVQQALADFERRLGEAVTEAALVLTDLDPNLTRTAEATRVRLAKEAERLRTRVLRAEKRRQEDLQQALARVQTHLFPAEKPQERLLSACYFLATSGFDLPQRLLEQLPLDTRTHYVVSDFGARVSA